jgi:hypothetical protein
LILQGDCGPLGTPCFYLWLKHVVAMPMPAYGDTGVAKAAGHPRVLVFVVCMLGKSHAGNGQCKVGQRRNAIHIDAISKPTRIVNLSVGPDVLHALCIMHEGYSLLHLLHV